MTETVYNFPEPTYEHGYPIYSAQERRECYRLETIAEHYFRTIPRKQKIELITRFVELLDDDDVLGVFDCDELGIGNNRAQDIRNVLVASGVDVDNYPINEEDDEEY